MSSPAPDSFRPPVFHSQPHSLHPAGPLQALGSSPPTLSSTKEDLIGRPSTGPMQTNPYITAAAFGQFAPPALSDSDRSASSASHQPTRSFAPLSIATHSDQYQYTSTELLGHRVATSKPAAGAPLSFLSTVLAKIQAWDPLASVAYNSLEARSASPYLYRVCLLLMLLSSLAVFIYMIINFSQSPPQVDFYSESIFIPITALEDRATRLLVYQTSPILLYLLVWVESFPEFPLSSCEIKDFQFISRIPLLDNPFYRPFYFQWAGSDDPSFGFAHPIQFTDDPLGSSFNSVAQLEIPDRCFTNYTRKTDSPVIRALLATKEQLQMIQSNQTKIDQYRRRRVEIRSFMQYIDLQSTITLSQRIDTHDQRHYSGRLSLPIPSAAQDKYQPQRRSCLFLIEPTIATVKETRQSVLELIGSMAGIWGILIALWQYIVIGVHAITKKVK